MMVWSAPKIDAAQRHVVFDVMLNILQVCVRLCEAYKQEYYSLRDAMKQEHPGKVGFRAGSSNVCTTCHSV